MPGQNRFRTLMRVAAGCVLVAPGAVAGQEPVPVPAAPPGVVEVAAPGTPAPPAAPAPDAAPAKPKGGFDWKQVPRTRPSPKLGNFPVPPAGPGYYSVLDQLTGNYLQAPPKWPYPRSGAIPPSFFDLDNFAYLDDPKNTEFDYSDPLHRIRRGEWLFVTGGELRGRYENNYNNRLTQTNNDYGLGRIRTYGDLWYKDDFRVFAEFIAAASTSQNLTPLPTDQNKADLLNLFVDAKLGVYADKPIYARVGRQELLFGSQRLISPLDWANSRRTFQGVRAFRQGAKWDVDAFWTQPVVPQANKFDSVDNNVNFAGLWTTYRPKKGQSLDAYYLLLDNVNRATILGVPRGPFTRHTIGSRIVGNEGQFLYDFEGAVQLGNQDGRAVVAGMATAGVGYNFKDTVWNPTLWAYYDYASGGGATGNGTVHTFNQIFPFGHYYLGWIDQVGRQNIQDLNFHLYLFPTPWLTTWVQFHSFFLADRNDALYNAAGVPTRRSPGGSAGRHVGEEVDLVLNFHLTKHVDLLTGYSHLFGGEFLRNTSTPTRAPNAGFSYAQLSYRW